MNKYLPFMEWILEVADEKIVEHRIIKKNFKSHEEYIIFTIIWMRVYKNLYKTLKNKNLTSSIDKFIKDFYDNQNNKYLGMTINAITRESEIPRSTVKRNVENLINRKLVSRNINRLIIPTNKVRDLMLVYRQYIFKSNTRLNDLFQKLNIKGRYTEKDKF